MGQGLKGNRRLLTRLPKDDVVRLVRPYGNARAGQVRDLEHKSGHLVFGFLELLLDLPDPVAHQAHLLYPGLAFLRVGRAADLFGCGVSLRPQALGPVEKLSTLGVESEDCVDGGVGVEVAHGLPNPFGLFANESDVEHTSPLGIEFGSRPEQVDQTVA